MTIDISVQPVRKTAKGDCNSQVRVGLISPRSKTSAARWLAVVSSAEPHGSDAVRLGSKGLTPPSDSLALPDLPVRVRPELAASHQRFDVAGISRTRLGEIGPSRLLSRCAWYRHLVLATNASCWKGVVLERSRDRACLGVCLIRQNFAQSSDESMSQRPSGGNPRRVVCRAVAMRTQQALRSASR